MRPDERKEYFFKMACEDTLLREDINNEFKEIEYKITEEFPSYSKTYRYENVECTITEKIDGTNALISISEDGEIKAGSRSRWLDYTKKGDNYGFCKWVIKNKKELIRLLPPGLHYGEWVGPGTNRSYNLKEHRLYLFDQRSAEIETDLFFTVPVLIKCNINNLNYELKSMPGKSDGMIILSTIDNKTPMEGVVIQFGPELKRQKLKVIFNKSRGGKCITQN